MLMLMLALPLTERVGDLKCFVGELESFIESDGRLVPVVRQLRLPGRTLPLLVQLCLALPLGLIPSLVGFAQSASERAPLAWGQHAQVALSPRLGRSASTTRRHVGLRVRGRARSNMVGVVAASTAYSGGRLGYAAGSVCGAAAQVDRLIGVGVELEEQQHETNHHKSNCQWEEAKVKC